MKTLRDAKVGDTVTVVRLHGEGAVKRRIMDMGITKGVDLYIRKVAPLGDPMELNLRGPAIEIRDAGNSSGTQVPYPLLALLRDRPGRPLQPGGFRRSVIGGSRRQLSNANVTGSTGEVSRVTRDWSATTA